jgi:hypothetical protein
MHQLNPIKSERKGRKNIFKISQEFKGILSSLPSLPDTLKKLSQNSKRNGIAQGVSQFDQVSMTKSILEEYNLPLSPRVAETMIISALKQKILSNLPSNIMLKSTKPIPTILKERSRFDIYLGNNGRYTAIEIKIIETVRSLRESIGNHYYS